VLSPVAILIAVHEVQVGQAGVTLKQLVDACSVCFDRPDVFTPQVLATALQQMVEFTPLPLLFMRTVIQAETIAPQLKEFTLGLLRTLINRQVWKMDQKIWEGFLRCLKRAAPQSFPLMVELPAPVFGDVLQKFPALKDNLRQFAAKSSVPKAIAAVLNEP
jgi:symplekin